MDMARTHYEDQFIIAPHVLHVVRLQHNSESQDGKRQKETELQYWLSGATFNNHINRIDIPRRAIRFDSHLSVICLVFRNNAFLQGTQRR